MATEILDRPAPTSVRLPTPDELCSTRLTLHDALEFGMDEDSTRVLSVLAAHRYKAMYPEMPSLLEPGDDISVSFEQVGQLHLHVRRTRELLRYFVDDLDRLDKALAYLEEIASTGECEEMDAEFDSYFRSFEITRSTFRLVDDDGEADQDG